MSDKLLSPGARFDANLRCLVRLVTRDPAGKGSTTDVVDIVGTDPVLIVFRQIF